MRISTRFTVIVATAGLLLFGCSAVIQFKAEQRDLRTAIHRELELLGKSLQTSIENSLRDEQTLDISETLAVLDRVDSRVDVYVFDADGALRGASPGAVGMAPIPTPSREVVTFEPPDAFERVTFVAPLADAGRSLGYMVIVRPLADAKSDLRRTGLVIVGGALFYLIVTALGVLLAGELYIGRPARRLMAAMRRFRARGGDGEEPAELATLRGNELEMLELEYSRLQRALEGAESRLRAANAERTALSSALQRADKLVTVGQLAAGLAHEVGSPLQVVHGRLSSLLSRPHDRERTVREVKIAIQQTERITRMVERLLGLTRKRHREGARQDVVAAVRAVVDLLEHQVESRGVEFRSEISSEAASREVDADPVQQIVLNLLNNALGATVRGDRVTLRIGLEAATKRGLDALRIEVEDTGSGMTDAEVEHAFEPFFTTRAEEGGTGLGLAVVRAMAEQRGGTVTLSSSRGRGTHVSVTLPLTRGAQDHAEDAA